MRTSTRHRWKRDILRHNQFICRFCQATMDVIHSSPGGHRLRRYTLRSGIIWTGAAPPCDNRKGIRGPKFNDHLLHCYFQWWYDYSSTVTLLNPSPQYLARVVEYQYPYDLPAIRSAVKQIV